jgi:hypothetical protein
MSCFLNQMTMVIWCKEQDIVTYLSHHFKKSIEGTCHFFFPMTDHFIYKKKVTDTFYWFFCFYNVVVKLHVIYVDIVSQRQYKCLLMKKLMFERDETNSRWREDGWYITCGSNISQRMKLNIIYFIRSKM